ncbi:MAG: trehalose-6-phosphate synthase [Phycisphaerales bacterium]|nr:trehalose-6-phosphate synthase [Phycisphaerales bacterium]
MPERRRSKLVVLANRLPVHRAGDGEWHTSPGGLVRAVLPIMKARTGAWVGWPGSSSRTPRLWTHEGVRLWPVAVPEREMDEYYGGMSNRTLWPLFHDAIRAPEFEPKWWEAYESANQRFVARALRAAGRRAQWWVHDYHLMLAPRLLRSARPAARVGFFLHIPFPPEELFAWLPWRRQLLDGLLGADVVGFQTHAAARNFSRAARRWTRAEGTDHELHIDGRKVSVDAFPISIDIDEFESLARDPSVIARSQQIRRRVGARRRIILAVDRIDYTKGIELRLEAFEAALTRGDITADRCVLIQIAVPSREATPEYMETRDRVERLVGRINGQFSTPGRVAVHYFRRQLAGDELVSYYLAADVMLVTPLRDGMNLVAKEFIACRLDNSGVLVLSEFAGAAEQFRRALLVNPRDFAAMGATLNRAMSLPRREAIMRMAIMRMLLRRHDVHEWADTFLRALERA